MPVIITLSVICSLIVILIATLIIRALRFKPYPEDERSKEEIDVDVDAAVHSLSEMIKCKTISDRNKENEDEAEFLKFKQLLPTLFPKVYEKCSYEEPSDRSILLRWEGKSHDAPSVLMSHYDVVSVVAENWERDPFAAELVDGVLWGRGTLDTKGTLNAALFAAEKLIGEGFVPENDVYFAFGGDEEINGHGASDIVKLFVERNITPALVVDEGGAVVEGVFPGVKEPCALIGIAEKGMLNVEYSVTGGGGHSSSPAPHTPVGKLSKACVMMEEHPFDFKLTPPTLKMFDTLARRSSFVYRLIFANLRFFSPVLNLITKASGGELNALVRTTTAFTQMEGSKGVNVIPPYAKMVSNHRILPGETMDSALARIRKTVKDEKVEIRKIDGMNPSKVSATDTEAWQRVRSAVADTWQNAIVSPYLMFACSDSRHWSEISDKVYRFSAMALTKEERGTIHGNNERVPVQTIKKSVEFYVRLIKKC